MARYLFRGSLSADGVAGLMKEGGSARRAIVTNAIESLGGSVESFYFAFGKDDVVCICELPDNETAAALAMEISASGRVSVSTTVLVTPEEVDRAREQEERLAPSRRMTARLAVDVPPTQLRVERD